MVGQDLTQESTLLDTSLLLSAIETELQLAVQPASGSGLEELGHIIAYAMGWEGEGAGPAAQGKRIRPLMVLLTTAAAGGEWQAALPAAAAVELLHNFSLIHDDIEDNSSLRRGRPTVWRNWGVAQAINTGDMLYALAHLASHRLAETASPEIALKAAPIFYHTCLQLTQGQYLDLTYQTRPGLSVADYWPMIGGKTAALLAACTGLGALIARAEAITCQAYAEFGRLLGLAFQAQDDLLGIWGNAAQIGKSTESDLVEGKKSLPVLYGLGKGGKFAELWSCGPISPQAAPAIAALLEAEGGRAYTEQTASQLTQDAMQALAAAHPQGEAGEALHDLAQKLINREK
jgi:geranylgeranyl diphosphate synthase type I